MTTKDPKEFLWNILKEGAPKTQSILHIKGDPKQIEEARKILESHEKLKGKIEVAKW